MRSKFTRSGLCFLILLVAVNIAEAAPTPIRLINFGRADWSRIETSGDFLRSPDPVTFEDESSEKLEFEEGAAQVTSVERSITKEEIALYVTSALAVLLTALCCFFCCKHCVCDGGRGRTVIYQQMPMTPFHSSTVRIINRRGAGEQAELNSDSATPPNGTINGAGATAATSGQNPPEAPPAYSQLL